MRIVIEIDEHRQPGPPPDVSVTRATPPGQAAGASEELPPIDAGMAAPLAGDGEGEMPQDAAPMGMDESTGAMSAGAAPEDDGEG